LQIELRYEIGSDVLRGKPMADQTFLLACAFALLVLSPPAIAMASGAEPFGVSRVSLPSSLKCTPVYPDTAMDATGQYVCKSLPGGSADFDQYILAFVAGVGICNVTAVTPYLEDDRRGTLTQLAFRKLAADMSGRYGPPDERMDHAASPSDSLDDVFQTAIVAEDRQIFDQWNDLKHAGTDLESASLVISGSNELGLAIFSVVRFSGNDGCLKHLESVTGDDDGDN
jgi:hypothetical protein